MGQLQPGYIGPHGHDYSEIFSLLRSYCDHTIVFIPQSGNAGDSLINLGAYKILADAGVAWELGHAALTYPNRVIVHSGGGGLVGDYPEADRFFKNNHAICTALILLPHTIRSFGETFSKMGRNCHLFAREENSYLFLLKEAKGGASLYISHDMAFLIDISLVDRASWDRQFLLLDSIKTSWSKMLLKIVFSRLAGNEISAIRTDLESTDHEVPERNLDLSILFSSGHLSGSKHFMSLGSTSSTAKVFRFIFRLFGEVRTNRLHVAIIGAIFGAHVTMLDNSYGKNWDVYEHSIRKHFKNVRFLRV